MTAAAVIAVLRSKTLRTVVSVAALLVVFTPVLVVGGAVSVLSQSAQACTTSGEVEQPAGGGHVAAGLFAQPLRLQSGHWYEVGATRYGGPEDPTSGEYGSIPDPSESYLPDHPDSYAELSVLSTNPANHGTFTFADANALDNLPYMTGLRVTNGVRQEVLYKRDIGYGQGPGQHNDLAERACRGRARSTRRRQGHGRCRQPALRDRLSLRGWTRTLPGHAAACLRLLIGNVICAARWWGSRRLRA
ncbi:MAG TPA: hypothetical protein VIJ39_15370 [Solirubrobacteraceae bacterium]